MQKAKFFIYSDKAGDEAFDAIVTALTKSSATFDDTDTSLKALIHPGFADEEYYWPTDVDNRAAAIADVVKTFGRENPYKRFSYDYQEHVYNVADRDRSVPGYVLPFLDNPKKIGLDPEAPPEGTRIQKVVDVEIGFANHGAPEQVHRAPGPQGISFLRRRDAARLLDLKTKNRNKTVHAFVVDQGMDPRYIDALGGGGTYQGIVWNTGVSPAPALGRLPTEHTDRYRSRPQWHAHMIVRNILALAGDNRGANKDIKIHDVPVIPDRVADVLGTATAIGFAYDAINDWVDNDLPSNARAVIVNAWGVKNRFRETPIGDFTENENHLLNEAILKLAVHNYPPPGGSAWKHNTKTAVVFAAGNNGLFTPNPEVGQLDRGPMRSIWYPAALPFVWSAAATDATGKWIGVSSQGPAGVLHPVLDPPDEKPDFALPSYFSEDVDSHVLNTGTSASCGLLAGMLAGHWRHRAKPPKKAFAAFNAKKLGHVNHSNRLGDGVPQDDKVGPP